MSDHDDTVFANDEEQAEEPHTINDSQATVPDGPTVDSTDSDNSKKKGRPRGSSSKSRNTTKDAKYNELKSMFDTLSDEKDELIEKKRLLNQEYIDMKTKLEDQIRANGTQLKEIQNMKTSNAHLNRKIANLEGINKSLKNENRDISGKLGNMEKTVEDLEMKNRNLQDTNNSVLQELSTTQQQLQDCETEKNELIEQIANVSNTEENERKTNAIMIYDNISQSLRNKLTHPKIDFEYLHLDLRNTTSSMAKLNSADVLVFMIGGKLIEEGMKGLSVYKLLTDLISKLDNQVYVIPVPPMALTGVSSQISLLNYKLNKMSQSDRLHVMDIPFMGIPRDQVLDQNQTLAYPIQEIICKEVSKIEAIPLPKQVPSTCTIAPEVESYEMTALIEIQPHHIGKIIGKSGSNISKIRKEHQVAMSIGRWCEPKRENRDDYATVMDAVSVTGLSSDVKKATKRIQDIVEFEGHTDPKRKKST